MSESNESVDFLDQPPSLESQDGPEDLLGNLDSDDDQRVVEQGAPAEQTTTAHEPEQPRFNHPHLKDKSPAEIEALFNLMQNTVQSQTRRINELSVPQSVPSVAETPEPKGDFFDDPILHMRRELAAAVAPINQEIANMKAQAIVNNAWQVVSEKFRDFERYRPHVEQMLTNMNVPPTHVTADLIESLYYGAKGFVATHEQNTEAARPEVPSGTPAQQTPPPQHRPSSAPLPTNTATKPRQLTEDERRMAREWGMTAEQFIEWGNKDEQDVAIPEVKNA